MIVSYIRWIYKLVIGIDPVIEQDNIMLAFVVNNYIYKMKFAKKIDSNSIKIINFQQVHYDGFLLINI